MLFGRSLKPLHFKIGLVMFVDLLDHIDVMVLDYNQYYGPEQCKVPDEPYYILRDNDLQGLQPLMH